MTETAFRELVGRSYQRLSSHQIDFLGVSTQYYNIRDRRGSYHFRAPLIYFNEQEEPRRVICNILFNPAFRRHFITYTLATDPKQVDDFIDQLLADKRATRSQQLLRITDESALRKEPLQEIKQGIALSLLGMKYWSFNRRKAQFRNDELGTIYLRPIREE